MGDMNTRGYAQLAAMFTRLEVRPDGSHYTKLKDDSPEWAQDFVREAHGVDMLPDDYRYEWICEACELLAESEDGDVDDLAHEFADAVDVYTSDLIAWLASHQTRQTYVDQAAEDGLVDTDADLTKRIMAGQYQERTDIFHRVVAAADKFEDELADA